jgi:Zn-dependent M28 family amino/carboxypeptidase
VASAPSRPRRSTHAYDAGASAVVIVNSAAGDLNGTLDEGFALDIPVTSVTQVVGDQLAATGGLVLHVVTSTFRGPATTYNVVAETPTGNDANDNGSGSAALLEVAEQLAKVKPVNTVRFAWWGAEESTLVGSSRYVAGLTDEERSRIALYLNFDMVGSPNPVFLVYDGDDSDATGAGPGPSGSDRIEKTFEAFYDQRQVPFKGTDFSGRSDYGPFIAAGIPSGGLFTGAEGAKTAEEAAIWGGTTGRAHDRCYHQACETLGNVDLHALDVNSDAMGFAILQYAMNTSDINGIPGKDNFPPVTPAP